MPKCLLICPRMVRTYQTYISPSTTVHAISNLSWSTTWRNEFNVSTTMLNMPAKLHPSGRLHRCAMFTRVERNEKENPQKPI